MNWRHKFVFVLALVLLSGAYAFPRIQEASAPAALPKPPKPQFFAGMVMEADASHVKVSRNLLGRPAETRVFALDGKTKTPKDGVKVKTRVTVRYQHMPERDIALEIEVRPLSRTPKTT